MPVFPPLPTDVEEGESLYYFVKTAPMIPKWCIRIFYILFLKIILNIPDIPLALWRTFLEHENIPQFS